jgi:hypothetical protein
LNLPPVNVSKRRFDLSVYGKKLLQKFSDSKAQPDESENPQEDKIRKRQNPQKDKIRKRTKSAKGQNPQKDKIRKRTKSANWRNLEALKKSANASNQPRLIPHESNHIIPTIPNSKEVPS